MGETSMKKMAQDLPWLREDSIWQRLRNQFWKFQKSLETSFEDNTVQIRKPDCVRP
jgi:hypothetical protein